MVTIPIKPRWGCGSFLLDGTNRYCSACNQTRRFLDRATHVQCDSCGKRLLKQHEPA